MTKPLDLKDIRYTLRLTQKEFAKKLLVSHSAVAKWEQNRRRVRRPMRKLITLLLDGEEALIDIINFLPEQILRGGRYYNFFLEKKNSNQFDKNEIDDDGKKKRDWIIGYDYYDSLSDTTEILIIFEGRLKRIVNKLQYWINHKEY